MQLRKELREDIEAQKEEQLAAAKEEFDEETQQIRSLLDIAHKQKVCWFLSPSSRWFYVLT